MSQYSFWEKKVRPPDLMFIGSHCVGLDYLMGEMQKRGVSCRFLAVGSMGGVMAAKRGECDISGIHLLMKILALQSDLITPELHFRRATEEVRGYFP
ncbi:MAG: hypothetical protein Ct9H300mP28_04930 [Pseudomonadota bacterium]|nr:MAG: hypothetical protein Ct9H300mP28_04930 [Pseudomonadota bacterium]